MGATTSRRWGIVVVGLLMVGAAGCSDGSDGETVAESVIPSDTERGDPGYVGTVDGTNAFIAVVFGGGEAVVYVCDGEAEIAEWFAGPTDTDGTVDLSNATGASVQATLQDGRFEGTVHLSGGDQHQFVAEAADQAGGLFRVLGAEAEEAEVIAGWIVDSDGDQRGSLRIRGRNQPAPAVPGATLDVGRGALPVVVFFVPSNPTPPAPGVPIPYPNTGTVATDKSP